MHYVNDSANAAYLRECREMEADVEGEWVILENKYDEGYAACVWTNFGTTTETRTAQG